jgi:hypothetical protein
VKNRLVVLLAGLSLGVLAACGGVSTGEPLGEPAQVDPVTHTPFCYACPVAPGQVTEMARTPVADDTGALYCLPCEGDGYCGDGVCNGAESCSSCSYDCGSCPPPAAYCGDGVCNGSESCSSCAGDCGACPPPDGGYCGDGVCAYPETRTNCRADCLYTCYYACP